MKTTSRNRAVLRLVAVLGVVIFCASCKNDYVPKPKAYMRIAVPQKQYRDFDSAAYGFAFRLPVYASVQAVPVKQEYANTQWLDICVPSLNAKIYLSYVRKPNLDSCITSTLFFIQRHMTKATGVDEREIYELENHRFGYLYHIKGRDVASPYQFYLTDSNRHFVRGSLSFATTPNNDSLAPLIEFLKTDIDTMLATWAWK